MALSIRLAQAQVISSNTTQDFTVSGFGTPQGAIIHLHAEGPNAGTDYAGARDAWNIWDGTTSYCVGMHGKDAEAQPTQWGGSWIYDDFDAYTRDADAVARSGSSITTITDGIRITWAGTTTVQPYATVYLIKGADNLQVSTFTASTTNGGTANASFSFNPDIVLTWANGATALDTFNGAPVLSRGFCLNDGSLTQKSFAYFGLDFISPTRSNLKVYSNRALADIGNSLTKDVGYEVTAIGSNAATFTTRVNAGVGIAVIGVVLGIGTTDSKEAFTATAPTGTGSWDPYTGTFQPNFVFMLPTTALAVDTGYTNDQSGTVGTYFVNSDADEYCSNACIQDNVSTTNNSTRREANLFVQGHAGGAPIFEADAAPTFDSTGLVFNVNTASTAYVIPGFAVGAGSINVTVNLRSIDGSTARANMTDIRWAWFDAPPATTAAVDAGLSETTDANGDLALTITGSALTSGQFGYLLLYNIANEYIGAYRVQVP